MIRIFATDQDGEREEITDLYWFEVNGVHDWDGQAFSLERSAFAALVQTGKLTAVPLQTDFIDIGIPDDYFRFCRWVEKGRQIPLCN